MRGLGLLLSRRLACCRCSFRNSGLAWLFAVHPVLLRP